MTITITLPPATQARLRALAEATGESMDWLVIEVVEARLRLAELSLRNIVAPVPAESRDSGLTEAELTEMWRESRDDVRETKLRQDDAPT
jgi:hypothetical protein